MIYNCCHQNRRNAVLAAAQASPPVDLNGIDYLEVVEADSLPAGSPPQRTLLVHCLNQLTQASWTTDNVMIAGGEKVTAITLDWVEPALPGSPPLSQASPPEQYYFAHLPDAPKVLVVRTRVAGDFSTYRLRLVNSAVQAAQDPFGVTQTLYGFDPRLAEVEFSFKAGCQLNFDYSAQPLNCPPVVVTPPAINYQAKDYGSFRTIILDRLNQLLPGWGGASEADIGVALAELIAYVGDHLSYQQDAVATEAYLETARRRVSLRRHARLVNYHVHDGCNARVWIQLQVSGSGVLLDHTQIRFYTFAPGMPPSLAGNEEAALFSGVQVFEPMRDAKLYAEQNQMRFYTWGDHDCCLPKGATEATLLGCLTSLQPGDVLIFQEVLGPQTGNPADADLRHRCAVRLTQVATRDGRGRPLQDALSNPPQALTEIQWCSDDALPFPLCLSSTFVNPDGNLQSAMDVSLAYGNVVLADHGLSFSGRPLGKVPEPRLFQPPNPAAARCQAPRPRTAIPARYEPALPDSPLTQAVPLPLAGNPVTPAAVLLTGTSYVSLVDSNGNVCLMARANQPWSWPQYFGVKTQPNGMNYANFDLIVFYSPRTGSVSVTLEAFANLDPARLDLAAVKVNSLSRLIRVQVAENPSASPPSAPFTGSPTPSLMLSNAGTVALPGAAAPDAAGFIVSPTNPAIWPQCFALLAQGLATTNRPGQAAFNLVVLYSPPAGGVGVNLPVTVELFSGLSLPAQGAFHLGADSQLIDVLSFGQAPSPSLSAYDLMNYDPAEAVPFITLTSTSSAGVTTWNPAQDLLASAGSDSAFVVEVESDGSATLRFGDNTNGAKPPSGTCFSADYRVGNGTAGNVGAEAITCWQIGKGPPGGNGTSVGNALGILRCHNPLPAVGGTDLETNDQIRRRAPQAFLTQERAVTTADYEAAAEMNPQVGRAAAALRWTGSWHTVCVAVEPQGGGNLSSSLEKSLRQSVGAYRSAGQDLEFASPQYVSLEIALTVQVDPSYFNLQVKAALLQVLSSQALPNGQTGVFYQDNFTFGQTVYLSPVYAAARSVAGVVSVTATKFQPQGVNTRQYLDSGQMKLAPLQVARLDNDPNYPDRGQLTLIMVGGK